MKLNEDGGKVMKCWSYRVIEFDPQKGFNLGGKVDVQEIEEQLNLLGQQGWEVVSNFTTNEGYGTTKKIVFTLKKEN